MLRAYGPINTRQQGADRLVMNEDDLRRVLWQAVDPNYTGVRPSTIRLGTDIILTRPIDLKATQYNVTIDGGRQFRIEESRRFSGQGFFKLEPGQTSDIDFINITFYIPSVANLFLCDSLSTVDDFNIQNCNVVGNAGVAYLFSVGITITDSKLHFDNIFNNVLFSPSPATFTGSLQISYVEGVFNQSHPIIFRNQNGVGFGTDGPTMATDIDGGMRIRPDSITLSGANPTIDPDDRSTFSIICDATSSGTIQILAGDSGQLLVLYFSAVDAGSSVKLDDTATVDVNKNHVAKKPLVNETVTFMYIDGKWRELCRSENL